VASDGDSPAALPRGPGKLAELARVVGSHVSMWAVAGAGRVGPGGGDRGGVVAAAGGQWGPGSRGLDQCEGVGRAEAPAQRSQPALTLTVRRETNR